MHEQAVEIAALLKSFKKLGGVVVDTTDSTSRVVYSVVVSEIIVVSTDTLIWSVLYSIMKSDPGNIHMGGGVMVLYSVAVVVGGRKEVVFINSVTETRNLNYRNTDLRSDDSDGRHGDKSAAEPLGFGLVLLQRGNLIGHGTAFSGASHNNLLPKCWDHTCQKKNESDKEFTLHFSHRRRIPSCLSFLSFALCSPFLIQRRRGEVL